MNESCHKHQVFKFSDTLKAVVVVPDFQLSTGFMAIAVCCSVLQCVLVCCSVLQCAVVCYSVLQCVAVLCCSVLRCVAVCCSVLQCVWCVIADTSEV